MIPLSALSASIARLRSDAIELPQLNVASLSFPHGSSALAMSVLIAGLSIAMLVGRSVIRRGIGRNQIIVPAVLGSSRRSYVLAIRYVPLLLFACGLPFFFVALADPYSSMGRQDVSYPGRRIALLIDASSSMMVPFPSRKLRDASSNEAAFLTTVAAAEAFVRHRATGKYRDLIALVEFGDEAYVVTPFTHDYDNVLLSLSLIGDWSEYMQFPDGGTAIGRAIDRGVGLFKAFDYLRAAGNVMVIFSDGEDTQVTTQGKTLHDVLGAAVTAKIPVYLIRARRGKRLGDVIPDAIWKPAIEATGGRFYAAASEDDVVAALGDIDRRAAGTIAITRYAVQRPQFRLFAAFAFGLWTLSILLTATISSFRKFP
jgi:hypothetical protein